MSLPIFNGVEKDLSMLQTAWAAMLNPFLAKPTNQINILKDVPLIVGVNVINHKLGRTMQGWFLTDSNAALQVYRYSPFNDLTLNLTSNAVATVSIGVF